MTKTKSNDESPSSSVNSEIIEIQTKEKITKKNQPDQLDKTSLLSKVNNSDKELDAFSGFGFSEDLINTLSKKGYKEPTPVSYTHLRAHET